MADKIAALLKFVNNDSRATKLLVIDVCFVISSLQRSKLNGKS